MLDIKQVRNQLSDVKTQLQKRKGQFDELDQVHNLDQQKREIIQEVEQLKNKRNLVSKEIAQKKKAKENADQEILEMRQVGDKIKSLDDDLRQIDENVHHMMLTLPNLPHESVPVGEDEEENQFVRQWGEVPQFDFAKKAHWELAEELDLLDFERGAKVSGTRFVFYKGLGARLERALMNFMLDLHTDQYGFTEILPPNIVNRGTLLGSGQLPKFEEDVFKVEGDDKYLIPTSEPAIVNYHQNEILDGESLPLQYAGFSACFRSEAGSAGRDTRGLIRLHQFYKVEMIKFTHPDESYHELEKMTAQAEAILQKLELPYRVVNLCSGDLGFAAAKTYDLEVWMPSNDTYREISSCSNTVDFQARRANIRFRQNKKDKPEFLHILNGSGLAIDRTVAAILENGQQADGSIRIPEVLRSYMGGRTHINK
ncbi:serine--tRNA ligase [Hazenella sp. IB182357]|uniref:Serine--tRNA ligase n=1 Tax=Polycladospora coralii TaxID=2771432 RepID=A0A926N5N7_9BACL|nr:serine--tRNA ligase [Polycladospora coralii]MBD1371959.1 serine--tRNA ligase [Polycladospora coralii]MBS7530463.1 serine--tRNA ligase [Polycladospora coralii]